MNRLKAIIIFMKCEFLVVIAEIRLQKIILETDMSDGKRPITKPPSERKSMKILYYDLKHCGMLRGPCAG